MERGGHPRLVTLTSAPLGPESDVPGRADETRGTSTGAPPRDFGDTLSTNAGCGGRRPGARRGNADGGGDGDLLTTGTLECTSAIVSQASASDTG